MEFAIDKENGIWLCTFHHRLFDNHMFIISNSGKIMFKTSIKEKTLNQIKKKTSKSNLEKEILTEKFIFYIKKRNQLVNRDDYT